MQQSAEPLPYEPEKFAQKYPNDEKLKEVMEAAQKLAAGLSPREPQENPVEARRRVDQGFDALRTETEERLEEFHKGERHERKNQFIEDGFEKIKTKHQAGIDATPNIENKLGGQFARDEELRLFEQRIANNAELKTKMDVLANKQGERIEAVLHVVSQAHDDYLKTHGLDRVNAPEPTPLQKDNSPQAIKHGEIGSPDFKAAIQKEMAAIEAQRAVELKAEIAREMAEIEAMRRNEAQQPAYPRFNR